MQIAPPGHSLVPDRLTEWRTQQGGRDKHARPKKNQHTKGVDPVIQPDWQPPDIDFFYYSPHDKAPFRRL